MSLTVICLYIMFGMSLFMFLHYKFLKIFEYCTSKSYQIRRYASTPSSSSVAVATQSRGIWQIPGPVHLPLLGTKWIFFWQYKISQIHKVYAKFNELYGPIVLEVTTSGFPIVHLFDRADIERVLRVPSKYPFRPPTEIVSMYRASRPDRYASVGITNEQGVKWHHLRSRLTANLTSPRVIQAFRPTLNEICDDFIALLRRKRNSTNGVVENFQDVANLMGFEAVCALMLGRRMGFLSFDPDQKVVQLAAAVKMLFVTQRDSNYGMGTWKYWPTKTWRDFVRSEEFIYKTISEIVDEAMAEEDWPTTESHDYDHRHVFRSILKQDDLDIREMKSAIVDFISAGIETLANTLSFILYYISQRTEIQTQIRSEFPDDDIQTEHISQAVFTKACLQETYRICPTAFCLARLLEEDCNLSGYDLKAGTIVLCQTKVACNNDDNFENAMHFDPNRWLDRKDGENVAAASGLVVPFGIGKRMCPGRRIVEMELTMLMAKLVKTFEIEYCGEMETECEFLLVPKVPVNLKLIDISVDRKY